MGKTTGGLREQALHRAVGPVILRSYIRQDKDKLRHTDSAGLLDTTKGIIVYDRGTVFKMYNFHSMEGAIKQAAKMKNACILVGGKAIDFKVTDSKTAYYKVETDGKSIGVLVNI